jgi:hypothetical protein
MLGIRAQLKNESLALRHPMRHHACVSDSHTLIRVPEKPKAGEKLVIIRTYLNEGVPQKLVGEVVVVMGWDPILGDTLPRVKHRDMATEFWLTEWRRL